MDTKMKRIITPILLVLFLMISGCQSTAESLGKTPPQEYIEVVQDGTSVNVEEELKASGADYVCKELYFGAGSSKNRRACFVKAPDPSLYEVLQVKLEDLPLAIVKDTGVIVLGIGEMAISCIMSGAYIPR
ncbi:MAG: hypothetical protein AAGC78_04475 [Cellvibrio sp.]|uniref:hypothetical protein n=1 Tax=Cellvibrio sp. TaxID=1965322 RepID=UPI0031ADCF2F